MVACNEAGRGLTGSSGLRVTVSRLQPAVFYRGLARPSVA